MRALSPPTCSTAEGRDNKLSRDLWKPILEKHGADLVPSGHDHTYGRGFTADNNTRLRIVERDADDF
ncbi:MAG: hypothetical protein ACRDQ7_26100 [Haloechinothrix sp.]